MNDLARYKIEYTFRDEGKKKRGNTHRIPMKTHPMTTIAPEDTDKKKEVVINDDNPNPFLTAVRAYEVKNLKLATIFGVVVFIISMMEMIPKINQPPQWLDKVPCTLAR